MHLLETYSLLSGAKIKSCYIHTEPVALPTEKKYITFHPECNKASARQYRYWKEVIEILYSNVQFKLRYNIIQTGLAEDKKYNVDQHFLGNINGHQLAFLLQNSSLHLGYDSFPMHLASHFDIKMVVLFAYYSKSSGPYFSTKNRIKILEPDFSKNKPCFAFEDPLDLINTIDYTIVANNVLQLLELC